MNYNICDPGAQNQRNSMKIFSKFPTVNVSKINFDR